MSNRPSGNDCKNQGRFRYGEERYDDLLSDELRKAIQLMVANISKSFIVEWYTSISPTNHDFVASCETLIEVALTKLAELCTKKLDKYKIGQLVISLLHDHILNDNISEKIKSVNSQIDNHEYDICQSSVVRLFGLLCTEDVRRVIFTQQPPDLTTPSNGSSRASHQTDHADSSQSSEGDTKTTSALYTLVIAMLTKAVFMPIVDSISDPNWLYAVIIWLCKKEEREEAARVESRKKEDATKMPSRFDDRFIPPSSATSIKSQQNPKITLTNTTRGYKSLDLEEGIDIASGSINFENPVCDSLKRPLDNIEIYATEEVKSSSSCYVLYCIRYDGLCYRHPSSGYNFIPENSELPIIDKRATANTRLMSTEPSTSRVTNNHDASGRKSFAKKMMIKRRFREFVILQLRLEENPKIRPYMKNIPKPTKLKAATQSIFSLPGITNFKLDQSTIRLRQRFLERFLVALNSSPFIANSYEFKEFFSYNLNTTSINISKSKSLILQVNLNKVFVDSVRSALSIIRSTIPGDTYNLGSNPDPDAWLIELQQRTLKLHVQTRTSHSKMNLERYIDSKLISFSDTPSRYNTLYNLYKQYENSNYKQSKGSRNGLLQARMVKSNSISSNTNSSSLLLSRSSSSNSNNLDSSSRSSSVESVYHDASSSLANLPTEECNSLKVCDSVPIASKLIDIIHYSISGDNSCSSSSFNFLARLMMGKTIERYALRLLEASFKLHNATFCINGITSSIWDESEDPPLDLENASLEEAVIHLTKLVQHNYTSSTFIPKQLLNLLMSKQIRFYLSQLGSHKRNKFVIYSFFVHLLDELEIVEQ